MAKKTKIRVSRGGLHGLEGPIKVGTVLEVSEIPDSWRDRVTVIGTSQGETPVTATDEERKKLFFETTKKLGSDKFNEDGSPDLRSLNEILPRGSRNFTTDERDRLWSAREG